MAQTKPKSRKIWWFLALIVLAAIAYGVVRWRKKPEVEVQTSKVLRQDLTSIVTASGEIKPLNWVNISATAYGQITSILVKEGQRVKKGQVLVLLESIQPAADVLAQKASINTAQADVRSVDAAVQAADAAHVTARADLARAQAEEEKARLEFGRVEGLFKERFASQSDHDAARVAHRVARAAIARAEALVNQTKGQADQARAQAASARARVEQMKANLTRVTNILTKTSFVAPLDGLVTNLPVHVGENVVMGIQNAPGSSLLTIADMSIITAEVKVDETDIVNVHLGEVAEVTIDAFPDRKFTGKVTEIGNTAIIRSTGQATSLSSAASQEAKDFKVVVTLDKPPAGLRPGFSTTAKIQTATRKAVLTVPLQAVAVRQKCDLDVDDEGQPRPSTGSRTPPDKTELQGLFVVTNGRSLFVQVKTGITGISDVEVTGELKEGDEVVTGSYKVLRTIRPRTRVRVNNEVTEKSETES
ncbi:MAG: efflux RND transporter periplasmic adaptor subunit [Candidatus Riflebacteria bacterium]|nr:efflux RND transporter periplasmic adaptor subunit [Candidatus Riflebacteria bacterium]